MSHMEHYSVGSTAIAMHLLRNLTELIAGAVYHIVTSWVFSPRLTRIISSITAAGKPFVHGSPV